MTRSRWTSFAALVAVLSLAGSGCSGTPAASQASGSPPSSPAPSASPSPVPASTTFEFVEADPVVTRAMTGIDEDYMNPGAVIDHDGTLHMYANVFTAWPGEMVVPHLTSTDGRSWKLADPAVALTSDDVPFADPGFDVSTGFVRDDGTWVLIFETTSIVKPWVLGVATAPGPDGPWTVAPKPILEPGPEGSADAGGLGWPSVVRLDDQYAMYYTSVDEPRGAPVISLATSPDGEIWTKTEKPVLQAEMRWEARKVDRPRVAVTSRGFAMVYAGGRLTDRGLAWSQDGRMWQRDGERPVITQATFPVRRNAWDAALIARDGELHYYLEIGFGGGTDPTTDVYLATAEIG